MPATYPVRTLGERLRAARDRWTQARFAETVGSSLSTWRRYERDEVPPDAKVLSKIAEVHGIDLNWLILGKEPMMTASAPNGPKLPPEGYALLPRYDVQASAGRGAVVHSEQIIDFVAFDLAWLRQTLGIDPKQAAVITAIGDSMYPTIADGDVLIIDLSIDRVLDNAIYALRFGDALSVKRVQLRPTGGLRIISDNTKYEADELGPDAVHDLHVVGRVIWHGGVM